MKMCFLLPKHAKNMSASHGNEDSENETGKNEASSFRFRRFRFLQLLRDDGFDFCFSVFVLCLGDPCLNSLPMFLLPQSLLLPVSFSPPPFSPPSFSPRPFSPPSFSPSLFVLILLAAWSLASIVVALSPYILWLFCLSFSLSFCVWFS